MKLGKSEYFVWFQHCSTGLSFGEYAGRGSACKPLHVQASVDDFTVQVVSTLPGERKDLTVRAKVVGIDGKVEAEQSYPASVSADSTLALGPLPEVVKDDRLHFVVLDLVDKSGQGIDHTVYWMQRVCRWGDLLKIHPVEVKAGILGQSVVNGETVYRVSVENTSPVPAVQVWLAGPRIPGEHRVTVGSAPETSVTT